MGKAGGRRRKSGPTKARANPLGKASKSTNDAALGLIRQLDSSSAEERLQACITLSNMFAPLEDEEQQQLEKVEKRAKQMAETVEVLVSNKAFKVLMKRVSDADPQVRQQACSALCTIAAAWDPVCEILAEEGIHLAALALLNDSTTNFPTVAIPETVILALQVLADLCNSSVAATKSFESNPALEKLCYLANGSHSGLPKALELAEGASKLLYTIMDGNKMLAMQLAQKGDALSQLASACADDQLAKESLFAALNCVGAFVSVGYLICQPDLVNPSKVGERALALAERALEVGPSPDFLTESLALEILINGCSPSGEAEEFGDEAAAKFEQSAVEQMCLAFVNHSVAKAVGQVLTVAESDIKTPFATQLGTRACALLDNIVQNASPEALKALEPQSVFVVSWRLLALGVVEKDNADTEEILDAVTALIWSIMRHTLDKSMGIPMVVTRDHLAGLFAAAQSTVSPNTRMNLVGVFGSIAGAMPQGLEQEDFTKLVMALVSCAADASMPVSVQAIDSLIDVFAEDDRHAQFMELKVGSAMKATLPRFRSSLQDQALFMDRSSLEEVTTNLVGFLEYKGVSV